MLTLVFFRIVVPSQVKPSWFKFGLPIRCERVRARSASLAQGELHAMHDSDKKVLICCRRSFNLPSRGNEEMRVPMQSANRTGWGCGAGRGYARPPSEIWWTFAPIVHQHIATEVRTDRPLWSDLPNKLAVTCGSEEPSGQTSATLHFIGNCT